MLNAFWYKKLKYDKHELIFITNKLTLDLID